MIGKEIADAIAPIVMWVAIVGGVLAVLGLVVWKITKGAKAEQRIDTLTQVEGDRNDAQQNIEAARVRRRARWRRKRRERRLQHPPDKPPAA